MIKKLKGALQKMGARARVTSSYNARLRTRCTRLLGAKPARLLNGAFMKLVGLPTTNGSAPKSI
jgi:hypothetical protein